MITLQSLILISQLNNIPVDEEQIIHSFALDDKDITVDQLKLISKKIGLKVKLRNAKFKDLSSLPLPAMIERTDGTFIILGRVNDEQVLLLDPLEETPVMVEKEKFESLWTGRIILAKNKVFKQQQLKFGLKWFLPSIVKYKKSFGDVLLAAFTLQLIGLASPLIMQVIIDKVLVHKGFSTLNVLMVGLIIIVLFEMILGMAKNYVFAHTTNRIDVMLSARLFDHLFRLPLRYFESRRVGETIARVREVENVREFLTGAPLSSILDILFLAVYIVVMYIYSKTLTNIVLLTLPFFIVLSIVVTPIFRNRLKERFSYGAEMQSFLVESVSGIQTIKSFALEPLSQKRWEERISNYVGSTFKTAILSGNAGAIGQFIQRTSDLIILWVGAHLVISGKISVGQLIAFRMLSGRVSGPILRLVQLWQDFQQTSISIERLGDIFNAQTEPHGDVNKVKLPAIQGTIELEHVNFRYRLDAPAVINDLTFKIPSGKTIGIVGRSGSGKSTLSKLIQRLYIPESGKIMIDGVDISLADPHWLRRQIGVVLQENFLFNGTVKENIAIHMPSASMELIINVAQIAGAHEFILGLPEGYDTQVGEKGSALSGGQRQRIAIARALLTNPRILIFDEATSALDYESESIIQRNLEMIAEGRTVLIIAHRMSTIKDADAIMVLDKGRIVEFNDHDSLMKQRGLYHYLFSQQEAKQVIDEKGDIC